MGGVRRTLAIASRNAQNWRRQEQVPRYSTLLRPKPELARITVIRVRNVRLMHVFQSSSEAAPVDGTEDGQLHPFLLRFPISSFGMCLGVCGQAGLWKSLATSRSTGFLRIPPYANLVIWCFALALTALVLVTYSLKLVFYPEAVRREFHHPVRVNFFFAPWIACLLLFIGLPPSIEMSTRGDLISWYLLMAPIICLEIKIYGQWMSGGKRGLSELANPASHLAVVGNFVGAVFGASVGLREGPVFFFAVGLAHYVVVFVTLYQRLPTTKEVLPPKELNPVFFLFVTSPCVASIAWEEIEGSYGYVSKMAFFLAVFLYASLAVRVNFFRGFRFSLAWWSYAYPTAAAANASIRYFQAVPNPTTLALSAAACTVSVAAAALLLVKTVHDFAFVPGSLFPNDLAIDTEGKSAVALGTGKRVHLVREYSDDFTGGAVVIDISN